MKIYFQKKLLTVCSFFRYSVSKMSFRGLYNNRFLPFVTNKSIEKRTNCANLATKMNRRWICGDVWMDILPSFDHAQLGLKMALISDRFDVLVDKHFDGKTELTLLNTITIRKDMEDEQIGSKAKLFVEINGKFVEFSMPDHSLPKKIRFRLLQIEYIDHSVITFLRANKQIWDKSGTNLQLFVSSADETEDNQRIFDVLAREIWPIFATNIRHLSFDDGHHLDNLCRLISPTVLTDLDQLNSIYSGRLFPDVIANDGSNRQILSKRLHTLITDDGGPNRQILYKWLHTPTKNGQPKTLFCRETVGLPNCKWVHNFEEAFLHATTSVAYNIWFNLYLVKMPIEEFELVNEGTNETLTLMRDESSTSVNFLENSSHKIILDKLIKLFIIC